MFINTQAQDLEIAGIYTDLDAHLLNLIKTNKIDPKPLMICSGSTSSSCAAKGHWTLDLSHRFKKIQLDSILKNPNSFLTTNDFS